MSEARIGLKTSAEFGQGLMEHCAMLKVIDPIKDAEKFVTHGLFGNQLRNALLRGVYAGDFASRIGDELYQRNFGVDYNARFVSVAEGHINSWLRWFAVMIPAGRVSDKENGHAYGEKLIHLRSRPREFMGIQVRMGAIDVDHVLSIAGEIWRENPQNSLPMYDGKDKSLIWPV